MNQKQKRKPLNLILTIALLSTLVFTGVGCNASFANATPLGNPTPVGAPATKTPITQSRGQLTKETASPKDALPLKKPEKVSFQSSLLKFFFAMIGVLASALAIFLGLKVYKKFVLKSGMGSNSSDYENSLDSPKDFKEAINLFLHKTDK